MPRLLKQSLAEEQSKFCKFCFIQAFLRVPQFCWLLLQAKIFALSTMQQMEYIEYLSSPFTFCGISPNTALKISDVPCDTFSGSDVKLARGDCNEIPNYISPCCKTYIHNFQFGIRMNETMTNFNRQCAKN